MIAFGSSISGAEAYRRYAEPGIRRAAEPDSEVLAYAAVEPVGRTYNLILEAAARIQGLEALVLVHPHTEIADDGLGEKVRLALSDPQVGAVGCAGARNVTSIAWWEGEVVAGDVRQRYEEHGGGEVPAARWAKRITPPAEVEALDGQLLVLSPWAVRNIRFDEALLLSHGFDLDFSLLVRQAGKRLVVADLAVVHHRPIEQVGDLAVWVQAHIEMAEKWDQVLHDPPADEPTWKRRARQAEARREAARAIAMSESLRLDARVLELERQLDAMTSTASWRLTAPLRVLNRLRRQARGRRAETGDDYSERRRWD
ncbi:MAG: glycosyltransferase [Solirubrobacteraceae bacterium]